MHFLSIFGLLSLLIFFTPFSSNAARPQHLAGLAGLAHLAAPVPLGTPTGRSSISSVTSSGSSSRYPASLRSTKYSRRYYMRAAGRPQPERPRGRAATLDSNAGTKGEKSRGRARGTGASRSRPSSASAVTRSARNPWSKTSHTTQIGRPEADVPALSESVRLLYESDNLDLALAYADEAVKATRVGTSEHDLALFQRERVRFNRLESPIDESNLRDLAISRNLSNTERQHSVFMYNQHAGMRSAELYPNRWNAWIDQVSKELRQPHLTPFERAVGQYHLDYAKIRNAQHTSKYANLHFVDHIENLRALKHPGALGHKKRYQASIDLLTKAVYTEFDRKKRAYYHYLLGLAYYQSQKKPRDNIAFLSKAIDSQVLPPSILEEALYLRAKLYQTSGKADLARQDLAMLTTGKAKPTPAEIESIRKVNAATEGALEPYLAEWIALETEANKLALAHALGEQIHGFMGRASARARLHAGIADTLLGKPALHYSKAYRNLGLEKLNLALESSGLTHKERLLGKYYRGMQYFYRQDYGAAVGNLAPVLEGGILSRENLTKTRMRYAEALYETKRYQESIQELRKLRTDQKSAKSVRVEDEQRTWLQLAEAHYYNRDYKESRRYLKTLRREKALTREMEDSIAELEDKLSFFESRIGGIIDFPARAWGALWN